MSVQEHLPLDVSDQIQRLRDLGEKAARTGASGRNDWYPTFDFAVLGCSWRLYGVSLHYHDLHAWFPRSQRAWGDTEYHIASLLFNMDSALECFCYSINALGNAESTELFRPVDDSTAVRAVRPADLYGDPGLPGYAAFFPTLRTLWIEKQKLIEEVMHQHDVSKHRMMLFTGGTQRLDPPPRYYEAVGMKDSAAVFGLTPWSRVLLRTPAKEPLPLRWRTPERAAVALEDLCDGFADLIQNSFQRTFDDVNATFASLRT